MIRICDILPPGEYPILNAMAIVGLLLVSATVLLAIFVAVRDGHLWNKRKDEP